MFKEYSNLFSAQKTLPSRFEVLLSSKLSEMEK